MAPKAINWAKKEDYANRTLKKQDDILAIVCLWKSVDQSERTFNFRLLPIKIHYLYYLNVSVLHLGKRISTISDSETQVFHITGRTKCFQLIGKYKNCPMVLV